MECGRWAAAALTLLAMAARAEDDCEHRAERAADLPLKGITRVVIEASAGYLKVIGDAGEANLSARGIACATSKSVLEDIQLKTRTAGQTAYLTVEMPSDVWSPFDWLGGRVALDLTVRLPRTMAIDVHDSSGSIEISDAGETSIDDDSGPISVNGINGDLEVDDGSGSMMIQNVTGNVRIEDGSGSILVGQVSGNVVVEGDGSGSIAIGDVEKDVRVERDGSGSISVSDVGGSFKVESDGSGGVVHRRVKGTVDIDD
jgi:DUF4097 and DUF4098 domain-containing protein YvlB